jgi:hypothetical protein
MTITRDDVTIEQGRSDWGGPLIRISLPYRLIQSAGWRAEETCTFRLRHTKGLEGMSGRDKGHGWHVDDISGGHGVFTWHGALEMRDPDNPEAAIDEMIDYLNHLAERDRVAEAMAAPLSDIAEALSNFNQSLEFRNYRDHNKEWPRFVAAVAAADAAFRATL